MNIVCSLVRGILLCFWGVLTIPKANANVLRTITDAYWEVKSDAHIKTNLQQRYASSRSAVKGGLVSWYREGWRQSQVSPPPSLGSCIINVQTVQEQNTRGCE